MKGFNLVKFDKNTAIKNPSMILNEYSRLIGLARDKCSELDSKITDVPYWLTSEDVARIQKLENQQGVAAGRIKVKTSMYLNEFLYIYTELQSKIISYNQERAKLEDLKDELNKFETWVEARKGSIFKW